MVPALSMVFMAISAILSVGLPLGVFLLLRKKYGLKAIPMLVGAAVFIVFAMVLEQGLHMLVLQRDAGGNILLLSRPALYVLYGCLAAGIFEETGRFVAFKLLKKKYAGIGTGLSYGIGHGGIEAVLLVGLAMINNLVISSIINSGGAEMLSNAPNMPQIIAAMTQTAPGVFLLGIAERIPAIAIQVALSLIVWFSVNAEKKAWLFPVAILLHALIDVPAAMMQAGALSNVLLVELIVVAEALLTVAIAVWMCKKIHRRAPGVSPDGSLDSEAELIKE